MLTFLETYKDQLGLLVSAALLIATIILIFVGLAQAVAARAQARAALMQLDESSRPILMIEKSNPNLEWMHPNQSHRVINKGYGVARKMKIHSDDIHGNSVLDSKVDDFVVLPVGISIPLNIRSSHHTVEFESRSGQRYMMSCVLGRNGFESVFLDSLREKGLWGSTKFNVTRAILTAKRKASGWPGRNPKT